MNSIGKLTTFTRLINENAAIVIPKVQRDYAYGRDEKKIREILDNMLDSMLKAVKDDRQEIFDFVYGGSYVKKNTHASGLIPLDGQQRLTTLFLLYFVASVIQPGVTDDDVAMLRKFRYETRQSATDFCNALLGDIRSYVLEYYRESGGSLRKLIEDNPKYLATYSTDPTISSMLNVIEVIEQKIKGLGDMKKEIWTRLCERDNILFYSLSLDKFGLDDDLYLKMNARGKKLTEFEIFKADFEKAVNNISSELKAEVSVKIDNRWMDVVWKYARLSDRDNYVRKADEGYMQLFRNLMRLELFRRRIEEKENRIAGIAEIVTDEGSVRQLIDYLDVIAGIDAGGGIDENWSRYFYFSDDVIGREDKIRLYWARQSRRPVVYLAMDRDLTMPELTWLFALYLAETCSLAPDDRKRCLRIISNLLTANIRAHSQRYNMLGGFLADVKEVFDNNGLVAGEHTFVSTACEEELLKARLFCRKDYDRLQKYENHKYLEGSLMLFIDKYADSADTQHERLFRELEHFCRVVDNDYNFDLLRINLISPETDYLQYDSGMEKDSGMTRRYFIHTPQDFSKFLIKNKERRNQEAILDVVSKELSPAQMLGCGDKCRQFPVDSWQYYYTKYLCANNVYTTYGIYAWDNLAARPLEMVMLNSSYHSPNNVEWRVLNYILIRLIGDGNIKYSLDSHGSSPFTMNESGTTLTITQQGWSVGCKHADAIESISGNRAYSVTRQDADTYVFDLADKDSGIDYIDLARMIIADLEAFFSHSDEEAEKS